MPRASAMRFSSATVSASRLPFLPAFEIFAEPFVMTGGGPYRTTQTVVMEIYQEGFKKLDLGVATALSYVLLAATLLVASFAIYGALYVSPGSPLAALTGNRPLPPEAAFGAGVLR